MTLTLFLSVQYSKSEIIFQKEDFSQPVNILDNSYALRYGNIVFLRLTVNFINAVANGEIWITLPSMYRPVKIVKGPMTKYNSEGTLLPESVTIQPDGAVFTDGEIQQNAWTFIYFVYPTV